MFGIGDFAELAFYYFSKAKYNVNAFTVDSQYINMDKFCKLPVIPFEDIEKFFHPNEYNMFIAIGYNKVNQIRKEKYLLAKSKGYNIISYIDSKATVAQNVTIGENCFIFEHNNIQPFVKIGNNCIIWSGNHIGHHSVIEDHCFIASHVVISGRCKIAEGTFIGVNVTIRDNTKIGKHNVIGAGAIILKDTSDYQVYRAIPTEPIPKSSLELKKI
ncbi:MAG: acetyltransferase [Candidatus Calescibacterium sp.]|nr:acetyltransferase [Candidatus Calescibacterium sp.]